MSEHEKFAFWEWQKKQKQIKCQFVLKLDSTKAKVFVFWEWQITISNPIPEKMNIFSKNKHCEVSYELLSLNLFWCWQAVDELQNLCKLCVISMQTLYNHCANVVQNVCLHRHTQTKTLPFALLEVLSLLNKTKYFVLRQYDWVCAALRMLKML